MVFSALDILLSIYLFSIKPLSLAIDFLEECVKHMQTQRVLSRPRWRGRSANLVSDDED
jgi:hypothetical protein